MINPGQPYTLPGADTVYLAEEMPKRGLFLRDLNQSREWPSWTRSGTRITVGHVEGYLIQGNILSHFGYDIVASEQIPWDDPQPTGLKVADLRPCGAETKVIELWRFSPALKTARAKAEAA